MNLNEAGLPLPGRELDEYMAEVMGWEWRNSVLVPPWQLRQVDTWLKQVAVDGYSIRGGPTVPPVPHYSITHAFFQVMEAIATIDTWETMERCIWRESTSQEERRLYVLLDTVTDRYQISVWMSDYPSRGAAYAHAVCVCAWKARHNEV